MPKLKNKYKTFLQLEFAQCWLLPLYLFWLYEGCHMYFSLVSSPRTCDLVDFNPYGQFSLLISMLFNIWFNNDLYSKTCGPSRLPWFLRLNIHFLFSIISDASTPILMLVLLRCMVHRSQVLVNPSSTTIEVLTSSCIFFKHTVDAQIHLVSMLIVYCCLDQVPSIEIHY
jgi:hypothetical protein